MHEHIRFTPLQVQMLLHYKCIAAPYAQYDRAHANSTAVAEQRDELIVWGYLMEETGSHSGYRCTLAGANYVARILTLA